MTEDQENRIRNWMGYIGETDKETIEEYIDACRTGRESLQYFLKRAEEVPNAPRDKKTGGRPAYKFMAPFSVERATDETRETEMDKIRQAIPCRKR